MTTLAQDLAALERLHEDFGFRYEELAKSLNTNESTLHRWRKGTGGEPTPVYLNRLEALETFLDELDTLFAEGKAARDWMDRSLPVLKGKTPRAMILDGHVDRVTGILYAMNAGVAL